MPETQREDQLSVTSSWTRGLTAVSIRPQSEAVAETRELDAFSPAKSLDSLRPETRRRGQGGAQSPSGPFPPISHSLLPANAVFLVSLHERALLLREGPRQPAPRHVETEAETWISLPGWQAAAIKPTARGCPNRPAPAETAPPAYVPPEHLSCSPARRRLGNPGPRSPHAVTRPGGPVARRANRIHRYRYVRNLEQGCWPAGNPPVLGDVGPSLGP